MVHGPVWEKAGAEPLLPIAVLVNVAVVVAPAVPLAARTIRLERRANGATIRRVRLNGLIILLSKAANGSFGTIQKRLPAYSRS
jgi:hypothetical protein